MSLNKLANVETGKRMNLNIGCSLLLVNDLLTVLGTSTFDELEIKELEVETLTVGGATRTDTLEATTLNTNSIIVAGTTTTLNLQVANEFKLGGNIISKDDGKEGYVLSTNGGGDWEMREPLPITSYGYSYTDIADFAIPNIAIYPLYQSATSETDEKNVVNSFPPNSYEKVANGIKVLNAGNYRIDGHIQVNFSNDELNYLHLTILKNGGKPPQNKEIRNAIKDVQEAFFFSEVMSLAVNDIVDIGIGWSGTGTQPQTEIIGWKLNMNRVY